MFGIKSLIVAIVMIASLAASNAEAGSQLRDGGYLAVLSTSPPLSTFFTVTDNGETLTWGPYTMTWNPATGKYEGTVGEPPNQVSHVAEFFPTPSGGAGDYTKTETPGGTHSGSYAKVS